MELRICENPQSLGQSAAEQTARVLRQCIRTQGQARLLLSTGASQFDTLSALVQQEVDWSRVEMFHLDEYCDLPETHPASFRRYLTERFIRKLPVALKQVHFVTGKPEDIPALTAQLRAAPIDLGLIGIGENAHIAFNDPPADFETEQAYIPVTLDEQCRRQQLGEGWFETLEQVPRQAISMTVRQIMSCRRIISCVPYPVKAEAVRRTLTAKETTNRIPATILKEHPDFTLYLDRDSARDILTVRL